MDSGTAHRRLPIQTEQLAAAVLRALSGNVQLHFEGGRVYDDARPVPVHAPHLQRQLLWADFESSRAVADALALRSRFSDTILHQRLMPDESIEKLLFEWLEQLRVESLAPSSLPGTRSNLIRNYRRWSDDFLDSGAAESSLGILLFAFSQIVWSRLMAQALPEHVQDLLEPVRASLAPSLGPALVGLRQCRDDQAAYARHALHIAHEIAQRVECEYEDSPETKAVRRGDFSLSLDFESGDADAPETQAIIGERGGIPGGRETYRVFTRRYDREVDAADLLRSGLAHEYREALDQRLVQEGVNIGRLSRALRALLTRPRRDGFQYGEEEGRIDGRRLASIVSSPAERRVFYQDRHTPVSHCAVSFLIDCSGSMKQYRADLAFIMDVLMRALDHAGVRSEILGFTTQAWNGGRAQKAWWAAGRPAAPGRLNELCHIVFKAASQPWRRARSSIVAMMKPDLFREGVDGEAVQWACERLLARDEERRVLFVISDGCPMDGATHLANDEFYLDRHLRSVVRHYGQHAGIEILGVGLGLDLSAYYARSLSLDLSEGVGNSVFDVFLALLAGQGKR
ncbi:cobaltochelatase CobT-related protein [Parapusillimonas sp. JC17]|uniref:cobaltochelatase CobT-related protein n=1 Tax=Parapusillimonas sp. JC17 TaxID=3445768 RepID=UPI003F9EEB0B